jgi:nitroimidazol reductase NimA-like FMN-containing flavoprotein (pyridoxamine 5'-phosphate oxidase superfamily)
VGVLTGEQLEFLKRHDLCRLATASKDAVPHVVPVVYAMDGENIVVAMDYGTKKLGNLRANPKAAIVVDETRPNMGVMVQGEGELFERGKEYVRLLRVLFDKFAYFRNNPWDEGESPTLKLQPVKAVFWGSASRKGSKSSGVKQTK